LEVGSTIVIDTDSVVGSGDLTLEATPTGGGDLFFSALGSLTPLNEVGNESLVADTTFSSGSLIGSINELRIEVTSIVSGGEGLAATLAIGNTTSGNNIFVSSGDIIDVTGRITIDVSGMVSTSNMLVSSTSLLTLGQNGVTTDFPAGSLVDFAGATVTGLPASMLSATLAVGNTTGPNDIVVDIGQAITGEVVGGGGTLTLRGGAAAAGQGQGVQVLGGNATSNGFGGGNLTIQGGAGLTTGAGGGIAINGGNSPGGFDGGITIGNFNTSSVGIVSGGLSTGTVTIGGDSSGFVSIKSNSVIRVGSFSTAPVEVGQALSGAVDIASRANSTFSVTGATLTLEAGVSSDLFLGARGSSTPLNEAGNEALVADSAFSSGSLVGSINELRAEVGTLGVGGGEDLASTLALGNNSGANDIEMAPGQALVGVGDLTVEATPTGGGDLFLGALGGLIPLNEIGQENLSTTNFGAISIIGALNELAGIVSVGVGSLAQTLVAGNVTGGTDLVVTAGDKITNTSGDLLISATTGDLLLEALGASTPLNETGQESLSTTTFSAISIMGILEVAQLL
jgi:hypothetical protein